MGNVTSPEARVLAVASRGHTEEERMTGLEGEAGDQEPLVKVVVVLEARDTLLATWILFPTYLRAGFLLVAASPVVYFFIGLYRARNEATSALAHWPAGILMLVVVGLAIAIYRRTKRDLQATPRLRGPHRYRFSTAGLEVESPTARSTLEWSAFERFRETRRYLLLFHTRWHVSVIPKRCVEDEGALEQLRSLFRRSIGSPDVHGT